MLLYAGGGAGTQPGGRVAGKAAELLQEGSNLLLCASWEEGRAPQGSGLQLLARWWQEQREELRSWLLAWACCRVPYPHLHGVEVCPQPFAASLSKSSRAQSVPGLSRFKLKGTVHLAEKPCIQTAAPAGAVPWADNRLPGSGVGSASGCSQQLLADSLQSPRSLVTGEETGVQRISELSEITASQGGLGQQRPPPRTQAQGSRGQVGSPRGRSGPQPPGVLAPEGRGGRAVAGRGMRLGRTASSRRPTPGLSVSALRPPPPSRPRQGWRCSRRRQLGARRSGRIVPEEGAASAGM